MKNFVSVALVLSLLFLVVGCSSGRYVSVQPGRPMYNRPAPPYPSAVWIDGNYYWRGNRYMYRPGYWTRPRPARVYRPGTWINTPRGYYWRRGGWGR